MTGFATSGAEPWNVEGSATSVLTASKLPYKYTVFYKQMHRIRRTVLAVKSYVASEF
jgi:hypothetical protein